MRSTKPTRYRTAGGNVVTYTPNPEPHPTNWGSWVCGGCHKTQSGQVVAPYAEQHAERCKAL